MTILLAATFALLLAAVVLSFQGMKDGVRNAPKDEIARLQTQLDQLRLEQDRLALEKQLQQVRSNPLPETAGPSDIEKMRAELAAKEAELARLAEEKADAEKKAETYRDEAGFIGGRELEKKDDELRRARLIRDALLIGKVSSFIANAEVGDFVTIDIVMPEQVQPGTILAIRRNTGILGQVKISDVTAEGAIASPMPGFGPVEPKVGDELIIPPQL
jgi:multidrug efflux pump subunit AcrA (membrane-fusion protein)